MSLIERIIKQSLPSLVMIIILSILMIRINDGLVVEDYKTANYLIIISSIINYLKELLSKHGLEIDTDNVEEEYKKIFNTKVLNLYYIVIVTMTITSELISHKRVIKMTKKRFVLEMIVITSLMFYLY